MSAADYQLAVNFIKNGPKPATGPTTEQSLSIYKYFKQGSIGDCNVPQPGMLQLTEKAKWNAWNSIKGMGQEDAKANYVKTLDAMRPGWKQEAQTHNITA